MGIATSTLSVAQSKLNVAAPYLIEQDWAAYTPEQHAFWAELVGRRMPQLRDHACQEYLDGFHQIGLREDRLPNLTEVSALLQPRTGWQSTPVSGFLPGNAFFEMLAARMFPTTTWLRARESMEYTPEPDIFHDVFGHVPMHAHPVFATSFKATDKSAPASPIPSNSSAWAVSSGSPSNLVSSARTAKSRSTAAASSPPTASAPASWPAAARSGTSTSMLSSTRSSKPVRCSPSSSR